MYWVHGNTGHTTLTTSTANTLLIPAALTASFGDHVISCMGGSHVITSQPITAIPLSADNDCMCFCLHVGMAMHREKNIEPV